MAHLVLVSVASAITMLVYNLVAPLYPLQAASRIQESVIGQVVAMYSIANLLAVPVAIYLARYISNAQLITLGLCVECAAMLVVAGLPYLSSYTFLMASFFFRLLQGFADTFINNASLTIVQSTSKANRVAVNLALLEALKSVGGATGPLVNLLLSKPLGFSMLFATVAAFLILLAVVNYFLSPRPTVLKRQLSQELLGSQEDTNDTSTRFETLEVEQPGVSLLQLCKERGVLFAVIQSVLLVAVWNYREPILPAHFLDLGISKSQMPIYFLISPLANAICGFLPLIFSRSASPRSMLLVGNICQAIVLIMIGPSRIFGISPTLPITAVGLALCGATYNFAYAPIVAEMQEASARYRDAPNLSERLSLLNMLSRPLGFFLGPIIGSLLTVSFSFAFTADCFMLALVAFTIVYWVFAPRATISTKRVIEETVLPL